MRRTTMPRMPHERASAGAKMFGALAVAFLVLAMVSVAIAFCGWVIMLLWGGIASQFEGMETISYPAGVLIGAALIFVGGFFKSN